MSAANDRMRVEVDGRTLSVSNLHKELFDQAGFTKGELLDYYSRIAGSLLPHLADRPLTVKRYPNGVSGPFFFEKNVPRGAPSWVRTVSLPTPGSTKDRDRIDYVVVDGRPTLIWLANLAAIELHTPQWTVGPRGGRRGTDLVVFDLDPGPPATVEECRDVAVRLRDAVREDGLSAYPKTSGSKGMQLSIPIAATDWGRTSEYARRVARRLAQQQPQRVVADMAKERRTGKVFIDWSQNDPAKTTVSVYSVRAREQPTVSTPVTWEEVEGGGELRFSTADVLERVDRYGDLHAPTLHGTARLP